MPKPRNHQNVHECNELMNGSVPIIKYTVLQTYKLQQTQQYGWISDTLSSKKFLEDHIKYNLFIHLKHLKNYKFVNFYI